MTLERAGAFRGYSKSELIDGTIYVVNAQYSRHMKVKTRLLLRLAEACEALPGSYEAWTEGSVEFDTYSLPEPDVLVTRRTPTGKFVVAEQLALVVEVADTTAAFDLGKKAKAYARGGLAEYWVVDLRRNRVVRHWSPAEGGYREHDTVDLGQDLESRTITGLKIETAGLI